MQIPPASSAAQAASILSQTTSKDKASGTAAAATGGSAAAADQVERSGEADPDRDAQGQGDGIGGEARERAAGEDTTDAQDERQAPPGGELPGEPPSQLDIIA